jgi:hypothetical protein
MNIFTLQNLRVFAHQYLVTGPVLNEPIQYRVSEGFIRFFKEAFIFIFAYTAHEVSAFNGCYLRLLLNKDVAIGKHELRQTIQMHVS